MVGGPHGLRAPLHHQYLLLAASLPAPLCQVSTAVGLQEPSEARLLWVQAS